MAFLRLLWVGSSLGEVELLALLMPLRSEAWDMQLLVGCDVCFQWPWKPGRAPLCNVRVNIGGQVDLCALQEASEGLPAGRGTPPSSWTAAPWTSQGS